MTSQFFWPCVDCKRVAAYQGDSGLRGRDRTKRTITKLSTVNCREAKSQARKPCAVMTQICIICNFCEALIRGLFELHWVPESHHLAESAASAEALNSPRRGIHWRGGRSRFSMLILFKPKSHASTENAPGPTRATPAPIEARRMAGPMPS